MTAIETTGLTKRYGDTTVVDHLDLEITAGTITGFVGPNGAGKTTTMRMLLGMIVPTEGKGVVLGRSIARPEQYLDRVGAMIEGPAFIPNLSGRANLAVLSALGAIPDTRIGAVLDQVALPDDAKPYRAYSLGMKQRLGIAAALLPRPDLLMLDEPTNGLDPEGIREMRALLESLASDGVTVFVSSHLLAELEHISERLVIIEHGKLRYQGTLKALLDQQMGRIDLAPERPEQLPALLGVLRRAGYTAARHDYSITVDAPSANAVVLNRLAATNDITLALLHPTISTLEDAFFAPTGTTT